MLSAETDSEGTVKHQFVGDVSDYRKYALLRALSVPPRRHAQRGGTVTVFLALRAAR